MVIGLAQHHGTLSIMVPSQETFTEQTNLPILESSNAEILSHRDIFYHPFANKEGVAQRHVVTDVRDNLERGRIEM